jgi:uncharacterized protein YgbK (DUF1537 family)
VNDCFIADDLSGALDAAGAFFRAGRTVTVALSPDAWPEVPAGEVVGVSTETRNASPAAARAAVLKTLDVLQARGARLVYKKIDSTLRGPIAAEVAALAERLPGVRLLFCPANPAVGRTVRHGVLLVHGIPVDATEFARDPVCPVRESHLARLLASVAGDRLVLPDAESASALEAAVREMDTRAGPWVGIGSGALARPVAARLADPRPAASRGVAPALPPGPVLLLCGSAHPANRSQAAALEAAEGIPVHPFNPLAPAAALAAAGRSLRDHGGASLVVDSLRVDSRAVLDALATAAATLIAESGVNRLLVTGGETAHALCRGLGVSALRFIDELEPGVALAHAAAGGKSLRWVIKPGGFGSSDAWVAAWHRLRQA